MKAFVTGGLGQAGSHVVEVLLARGGEVIVVDNLATGRREHLTDHSKLKCAKNIIEISLEIN